MKYIFRQIVLIITVITVISACSLSVSSFSNNLNQAVMSSNDPATVMQALPAYIVLLDSMIEDDPEDIDTLIASSKLMNAYAGLIGSKLDLLEEDSLEFNQRKSQQKKLSNKAMQRSLIAICLYEEYLCDLDKAEYALFEQKITQIEEDDLEIIYALAAAWASWLQVNKDDWNATAQLPRIKLLMQKVVEIDETHDNAAAHMYLGVLNSLLPESLGGKPETGKFHFEKVIEITKGNSLMAKAFYAEYYARLTFNQELHDNLIAEILKTDKYEKKFTLINTLAKEKARSLQRTAEDYF